MTQILPRFLGHTGGSAKPSWCNPPHPSTQARSAFQSRAQEGTARHNRPTPRYLGDICQAVDRYLGDLQLVELDGRLNAGEPGRAERIPMRNHPGPRPPRFPSLLRILAAAVRFPFEISGYLGVPLESV